MHLQNPWFFSAIIGVIVLFHLDLIADLLNLSRLPRGNADESEDSKQAREKLVEYNVASTRHGLLSSAVSLALLLVFWFLGGFGWLDQWTRSFGLDAALTSVAAIAVLAFAQSVVSLPFDIYDTFVIEQRFGFNRTTIATFIGDFIKGALLSAIIGLPLLWLVVWFFQTQELAALWSFLCVAAFTLIMSFLAPRLIMPMFLKFTPLGDGTLRESILALSRKLSFPVADVSVVDGSRRSTKGNAFFAGFGKTKRIALYDTLISAHTEPEIVAVLAHEIGHCKKGHVSRMMLMGLAQMGVMFALLHFALRSPGLFSAFGVGSMSTGIGMVLFSIVYRPVSVLMSLLSLAQSRRYEFEADAFASASVESARPMIDALRKLSADHLAHPAPHPFYVALNYSHPPVSDRVAALGALR